MKTKAWPLSSPIPFRRRVRTAFTGYLSKKSVASGLLQPAGENWQSSSMCQKLFLWTRGPPNPRNCLPPSGLRNTTAAYGWTEMMEYPSPILLITYLRRCFANYDSKVGVSMSARPFTARDNLYADGPSWTWGYISLKSVHIATVNSPLRSGPNRDRTTWEPIKNSDLAAVERRCQS